MRFYLICLLSIFLIGCEALEPPKKDLAAAQMIHGDVKAGFEDASWYSALQSVEVVGDTVTGIVTTENKQIASDVCSGISMTVYAKDKGFSSSHSVRIKSKSGKVLVYRMSLAQSC